MSELPTLPEFLEAVQNCDSLDELKEVFPGDPRTKYDKRYSLARNWIQHYSKSGLISLHRESIPEGNYQYRFELTDRGNEVLEVADDG